MDEQPFLNTISVERVICPDVFLPTPQGATGIFGQAQSGQGSIAGWPQVYDFITVNYKMEDYQVLNAPDGFEQGLPSAFIPYHHSHNVANKGQHLLPKNMGAGRSTGEVIGPAVNSPTITQAPVSSKSSSRGRAGPVLQASRHNNEGECDEEQRRLRNRESTKKCQKKKKRYMEEMEREAMKLESQWYYLRGEVHTLESEIVTLKYEILRHRYCGSHIIDAYITDSARQLANTAEQNLLGYVGYNSI